MLLREEEYQRKFVNENTERVVFPYTEELMGARIFFKDMTDRVELHSHPEDQMTYVLKGKLKFFSGDQEYVVTPGDVLYFKSDVPHGCIVLEANSEVLDIFTPMRQDFIC